MPDVISRICKGCGKELPLTAFHKQKCGQYGHRSQCRDCRAAHNAANREYTAEYGRKYRAENREAKAARDKAYQQKHRDKIAEYQKAYRQENSQAASEYQREYRKEHREALIEYGREYYKANRHKRAEYSREYYRQNREMVLASIERYRKLNPDKWLEAQRRRRAAVRGATVVRFSAADLDSRMSYFGYKCWMCSGPFEHVDHVKPLSKGGSHMLSNLRPACRSCNSSKSAKWPFTLEDATWLCP